MSARVFCVSCRHFDGDKWCNHPNEYREFATPVCLITGAVADVYEKNANNDCPDYEAGPRPSRPKPPDPHRKVWW